MQPANQTPPAPPPIPPSGQNPYSFITDPQQPPKKTLFSGSKKKRIAIAAGGAATLLIIFGMLFSLIFNRTTDITDQLVVIARQQNELIRIADIGTDKARSTDAQNLAMTTKLSLSSQQQNLLGIVGANGQKLSPKDLSQSQDANNDRLLNEAEQNNRFDEVFIEMLEAELLAYQKNLETVFNQTSDEKTRQDLASHYLSASLLAGVKEEAEE